MSESLQRLTILHTNDIHSHFEAMPKIKQFIDQHRKVLSDDELLVIDCGDHMDRAFVETEGSDGMANIAVMNATGYDAAVPGNNEGLTFSIESLEHLYGEQAEFPVIGSNMYMLESGEIPAWLKPYMIIQKKGLKIGLIGVTVSYPEFYELLGWDIRDPFTTVSELVEELRSQVHLLIVISHLGLPADERMASEISGIDCILGAHTHHLLIEPLMIGSTAICAAGKFGDYVGKLELVYDHEAGRVREIRGSCVMTKPLRHSPELQAVIEYYRNEGERNLQQVVTTIPCKLDIDWQEESRLGNLLAAGVRRWCDAEIGIVNSGQLLGGLDAGEVTRGRLLTICPSPINPCRMVLRGSDIREALEESLISSFQSKPIRGYGFRGDVLGMLCVSGMRIEVKHDAPDMHKIARILIGDRELTDDQEVVVGTIDMFTFGIGYHALSRGRELKFYLPEFLRDVLLHQLSDQESIASSAERHWIYKED